MLLAVVCARQVVVAFVRSRVTSPVVKRMADLTRVRDLMMTKRCSGAQTKQGWVWVCGRERAPPTFLPFLALPVEVKQFEKASKV